MLFPAALFLYIYIDLVIFEWRMRRAGNGSGKNLRYPRGADSGGAGAGGSVRSEEEGMMTHQADCKTIVDPECGPCTCPTPSALTREQVEMQVMLCQGPHSTQIRDGAAALLLDHFAAQRATMAQQAQELERLNLDLQERRTMCRKATQAIIDAIGSDGPENVDHAVDRLINKFAAMTTERDEAIGSFNDAIARETERNHDLATAQARVKELESKIHRYNHWTPEHTLEQWVKELEATLAALKPTQSS